MRARPIHPTAAPIVLAAPIAGCYHAIVATVVPLKLSRPHVKGSGVAAVATKVGAGIMIQFSLCLLPSF